MELEDAVSIFSLFIGLAIGFLIKFFNSYSEEKAKNLATKEDIGKITREIESVKIGYSKEIEEFKMFLQKNIVEHQVVFSNLHSKRIEILSSIYLRMLNYISEIKLAADSLYYADQSEKTKFYTEYFSKLRELSTNLEEIEIFLNEDFCAKLREFNEKLFVYVYQLNSAKNKEFKAIVTKKDEDFVDAETAIQNAQDFFRRNIPQFKNDILNEIRKIIGSS